MFLCPKCYQLALIKLNYKKQEEISIECSYCKYKNISSLSDYLIHNNTLQMFYKQDNECKEHKKAYISYFSTCNKHLCNDFALFHNGEHSIVQLKLYNRIKREKDNSIK